MSYRVILTWLFFLVIFTSGAQINALFVHDNSPDQESGDLIYGLLEQYLGEMAYFNAVDSGRSPEYEEMAPYNLVVWYCGIDDDGLFLWNNKYQDNPFLMEYLDKGGNLWLMGRDYLNARFIKPPRNFSEGTFLYDYLGIRKWISETYTNDNGVGVRVLFEDESSPVNPSLDSINWDEPTGKMLDGCELVDGCHRTYYFAPGTYALYGQPTAFYYPAKGFKNVTFTFDPADMDSQGNMSTLLSDILRFYEGVLDVEVYGVADDWLTCFPNPATTELRVHTILTGHIDLALLDAAGNRVAEMKISNTDPSGVRTYLPVAHLSPGIYILQASNGTDSLFEKVIISVN